MWCICVNVTLELKRLISLYPVVSAADPLGVACQIQFIEWVIYISSMIPFHHLWSIYPSHHGTLNQCCVHVGQRWVNIAWTLRQCLAVPIWYMYASVRGQCNMHGCKYLLDSDSSRDYLPADPMLDWCWSGVSDVGPSLFQHGSTTPVC